MLTIQYTWSSPLSEEAHFSLPPLTCELPPRRGLRHYLVGTPEETQLAVDRLHLLHYAERFEWTRPLATPRKRHRSQHQPRRSAALSAPR